MFPKLRSIFLLQCLFLCPVLAIAQNVLFLGPDSGRITGGAMANTNNFSLAPSQGIFDLGQRARPRLEIPLARNPISLLAPTGPAGSNEFYDAMTTIEAIAAPRAPISFRGIIDRGTNIPPDPHLAAGPDHLVATVNSQFAIFDKSGNMLKLINANAWFANVLPGADPFDPQVVYDHHAGRFVMVWAHLDESSRRAYLLLSVSDDSDPLGIWCNWRIPANQNGSTPNNFFNDYPKLGVDEYAIYVTANMFEILGGGQFRYQYVQVRVIPKRQLLNQACGPVKWIDFWDLRDPSNLDQRLRTVVPAVTFGKPGIEYLINDSPYSTGTFMTLWMLIDPAGTPTLVANNVPVTATVGQPSNAHQLGGSTTLIEVGGRTVRNAVYMNGSLWTAHSVAGGTGRAYAFARYVRIDVNAGVALEDVAFGADNFWYYYPAIQADGNGNLYMVFTRSGHTEYPSVRYTGRLASDPPGLQASALLKAGEDNYVKTFGSGRNRWGDYSGIALDPADSSRVWMFGEYAAQRVGAGESASRWGTWIGGAIFTPLPGPHISLEPDSLQFGTLELGQSSASYPITISNIGSAPLTLFTITTRLPSFKLSNLPALPLTLRSFGDATFSVQFSPILPGMLADTILIVSNEISNPTAIIPLAGRALGNATLRGAVRDSLTALPINARLEFFRQGESSPRAQINTNPDGSYAVTVLEGEYEIRVLPEIPYPPVRRAGVVHTLGGSEENFLLRPASLALVVDDSAGTAREVLGGIFNELGYQYALWNLAEQGEAVPFAKMAQLAAPKILVWATGETSTNVISPVQRSGLIAYLNRGGSLILTGDNIAETAPANDSLMALYLGVTFNSNFSQVVMRGFVGDPIGNGLTTGAPGVSKDQLQIVAAPKFQISKVFRYGTSAADSVRIAAVRVQDPVAGWKAVYFGFKLEALTQLNRKVVVERTLNWLRGSPSVAVNESMQSHLPAHFYLEQNYPNPFNPTTTISFKLPKAAFVTLKVYDLLGHEVAVLVNEKKAAGKYSVQWRPANLPSGVYVYRLRTGEVVASRKLLFLK